MAMGLHNGFGNEPPAEALARRTMDDSIGADAVKARQMLALENNPDYGASGEPSLIEGETTQNSRASPPVRNGKKPLAPPSALVPFASLERAQTSRVPQPGQADLQKIETAALPAPQRETSILDPMTLLGPLPTMGTMKDALSPTGLMPVTVSPLTQTSEPAVPQSPYTVPATHIYVETPLHAPVWSNALGERVLWLMENGQHKAKLHINPEHLGPIDVTLTLKGNEVGIAFTSAQPEVRSALDLALPQLRETLAQGGVEMGNSTVSADTQGSGEQGADPAPGQRVFIAPARPDDAASNPQQGMPARPERASRSLLDTYA
jgi:flagellar hook-length control protein FliK